MARSGASLEDLGLEEGGVIYVTIETDIAPLQPYRATILSATEDGPNDTVVNLEYDIEDWPGEYETRLVNEICLIDVGSGETYHWTKPTDALAQGSYVTGAGGEVRWWEWVTVDDLVMALDAASVCLAGKHALELGCGRHPFFEHMPEGTFDLRKLVASDSNEELIEGKTSTRWLEYKQLDADNMPKVKDGSYALVLEKAVLDALSECPVISRQIVSEARRTLSADGIFVSITSRTESERRDLMDEAGFRHVCLRDVAAPTAANVERAYLHVYQR